jgi:homoserine dehydrogenase
MTRASLRVGVLGAGTVGTEVIRGLLERGDSLGAEGCRFEVTGIAVRDVDGARRRGLPDALLTDAPAHLVASPDTDVIVELMGGAEPAQTLIAAALAAGKPVVTANKQVVAHRGAELERISRRTGAALRLEAAVGGGIPVLRPLAEDLAANDVRRVRGIVNGTTNYILTEMAAGRGTYDEVLRGAQERGYAEADPSGDVEGRDAVNKLVILVRLAFGGWLDPTRVADRPPRSQGRGQAGITGVTSDAIDGAAALGLKIRLIATGQQLHETADRPSIAAGVIPTAVPAESSFGRTDGVTNRIEIDAAPVGRVGFDGPGAGGKATASAVLGDLIAISRGQGSTWAGLPPMSTTRVDAVDPVQRAVRQWFLFVPAANVRRGDVMGTDVIESTARVAAGLAIRTCPLTLADLRSGLDPSAGDFPIYPIDD